MSQLGHNIMALPPLLPALKLYTNICIYLFKIDEDFVRLALKKKTIRKAAARP